MTAQDKTLKENTASSPLPIVAPGTCVETGEQAKLVLGMYDHLVETVREYNPSADFPQIIQLTATLRATAFFWLQAVYFTGKVCR